MSSRPLNIVVNCRMLFGDQLDGIGRLSFEVMRRLAQLRPNDNFICVYDRTHQNYYELGDNVQNVILKPQARHPLLWKIWFDFGIPRILRQHNADCFISLDGFNSNQEDVPSIIIGHDIAPLHYPLHMKWIHRKYYKRFLPLFLKNSTAIVANSLFTKNDIQRTLQIAEDKIHVAHSGHNKRFTPISEIEKQEVQSRYSNGKPYFIFTGTRSPRKNLVRLIAAFEKFIENTSLDYNLLIVGKPGWKENLFQKTLNSSNAAASIHLLENIDNTSILSLVAAGEASVFVSLYEGFGLPIIEAMSCNVPVICSNVASMPEVAGDAALLVNPESIPDIAKAMIEVVTNLDLRNSLIEKGSRQYQKYSWDDQANKINELINELCKQ